MTFWQKVACFCLSIKHKLSCIKTFYFTGTGEEERSAAKQKNDQRYIRVNKGISFILVGTILILIEHYFKYIYLPHMFMVKQ